MDREEQIKFLKEAEKRANENHRRRRANASYRAFVEQFDEKVEGEYELPRIAL